MNLIKIYKDRENVENLNVPNEFVLLREFRELDINKTIPIVEDMIDKLSQINPEYKGEITKEAMTSHYLNINESYYEKFTLNQKFKEHETSTKFIAPKLYEKNYFIFNNLVYVPLLFLEKAPVDRIYQPEKNKNKIFININLVYNFTFDFIESKVKFKQKNIDMELFLRVFFEYDDAYLDTLLEKGFIETKDVNQDDKKKFIKFLHFSKVDYFEDKIIADWMDKYFLLEYYREIFKDYYGIDNLKDIVKKVFDVYENDSLIDMADLRNRRLVMFEYLFKPLFELYTRNLWSIIDKQHTNWLGTMNEYSITTSGFKNLHNGTLYDLSLPFASPLIHKVSQAISIIKKNRLPTSWVSNHKTGFGNVCPISVSAQHTASNIVFTSDTKVNKYGRIYINENLINE